VDPLAPCAQSFGYAPNGNLTYKSDVGVLTYGDPAHPHAVKNAAGKFINPSIRNVAAVLARAPDASPNPQQKQDLAAFIHLCGAGPASAYARRGFQVTAGERCGDHLVAAYLAKVNAMKRQFLSLAADGRN